MTLVDVVHRGHSSHLTTNTGQALEDRFEVLKDIGDGSFGSVVLARVRGAGASVARRGTVVSCAGTEEVSRPFSSLTIYRLRSRR